MYFRLSIMGTLPGDEKWTVNPAFHLNLTIGPAWDQASGDAIVQALVAAVTTAALPTSLKNLMSSAAYITGYRLEGRDEDESLLGVSEAFYPTPINGLGTMTKTLQAATVLSLRTNTPGARGRGRMYWPALGAALSTTTGRLTTPTTAAIATDAVALMVLIQETIEANAGIFPFSDVLLGVRSVTDHQTRTVVRIQVGDVVDTQRRRRDTLPETYASAAMP
jgi:hypothetical protein